MQKQRTFEALIEQLVGLAREQPVLELYEDVHWVDPSTLELLDLVVERARCLPVLVVITYRPEFSPPWSGQAHVTALTTEPPRAAPGGAMVARVTGGKALPAEILDADPGTHRRRAAVRRGADQDGARVGPADRRRRPLRAVRARCRRSRSRRPCTIR